MLIYIFLNCILNYFVHTLKELKLFWAEAIISIIECVLLIGGFLIVWLQFDLALPLIPIIYIATMVCAILFSVFYLNHNKQFGINVFKFVKIKLSREENLIIWRMTAIQIVWQVGYTMLAYFLLRVSDIFFNQYSYFENVLDIFNGFFFSFITITSIDICRSLGKGNFDEAYKNGKNSLYATCVIWFLYFVSSLIFAFPLLKGMNSDIQVLALTALILYVFMHLFRFLSWNLSSYILCWGGELKILFWQEVFAAVYYLVFYFIAELLPVNLYLIYFIITLPPIMQTIIDLIIFKRKKWMKKLSDEMNIKVVVFDFDDTLYSGCDWQPWDEFCQKGLKAMFDDLSQTEFQKLQNKINKNGISDAAIVKLMMQNKKDINQWLEYRDNNICDIDYSVCEKTDNEVLKDFAKKYTLYIVSNSTIKDIKNTAQILNIDLTMFKDIIVNKYENGKISKKVLYEKILQIENITPAEMFVIGNSQSSDINPAIELGANAKIVKTADFELTDFGL